MPYVWVNKPYVGDKLRYILTQEHFEIDETSILAYIMAWGQAISVTNCDPVPQRIYSFVYTEIMEFS